MSNPISLSRETAFGYAGDALATMMGESVRDDHFYNLVFDESEIESIWPSENKMPKERSGISDIDLSSWRKVDPMTLSQASFLWCGKIPKQNVYDDPQAHVQFEKFKAATFNNSLRLELDNYEAYRLSMHQGGKDENGEIIQPLTKVTIEYLIRYANIVREYPEFLFPGGELAGDIASRRSDSL